MKRLGLIEKWSNKKGGSTVIEIIVSITLITFLLFYPLATFTLSQKQNLLEDTLTTSMQMVSIEGGLTDRVEELIFLNLESKGLLPENSYENPDIKDKVTINTNADARGGHTQNLKYRDDEDPKISLEILYPADKEIRFLNGVIGLVSKDKTINHDGVSWNYRMSGFTLSERVN